MAALPHYRGVAGSPIGRKKKEPENAAVETRSNVLSLTENGDAIIAGNDGLRGHARPDA
jgi:hypothetical protein